MVTKKISESSAKKTAGELAVGDRFRVSENDVWQEVVSLEKGESDLLEDDQLTKKETVSCETKVDGSIEKFRFKSFTKVEVEVLNA